MPFGCKHISLCGLNILWRMNNVYNTKKQTSKFISKVDIRRLYFYCIFSSTSNRPASDTFRTVSGVTQTAIGNRCRRQSCLGFPQALSGVMFLIIKEN